MAKEDITVVKFDTTKAQEDSIKFKDSVKNLKEELKRLKDTLIDAEEGSEKYNSALQRAASIQHQLKEQMQEINASAMDFGQITSNTTKAIGGFVGGLQAAKATMNLFGIENEDVIKSLQKMQSLMAITQALPAIDEGIKAYKRLAIAIKGTVTALRGVSTALVATGIGAAVVAVGLLAANWDKVTDAMKRWGIINEDTKKNLDEQKKKVEELRGELAKLEGSYQEWEKQQKYSKLNANAKNEYDNLTESITRYEKQLEIIVAKQKLPENQSRKNWEALNQEGLALRNQIDAWKGQQQAILDNAESYKKLTKASKESKDEANELAILMADASRSLKPSSLYDELLAKLGGKPITVPIQVKFEEDEEEVDTTFEDNYRKKIESIVESLRNAFVTPEEQYQTEINALNVALETKLVSQEEYYRMVDNLNKEQTQREIMRYSTAASSIGSIFTSLGSLMEEGSEEQKALQIMGATINMLGGITAAIAGAFTTKSGPWDIALAALQATAIAAGGAATIAQMSKTNKNNASSLATANPASSALNNIIAPVQYTRDVQGAAIEGAIRDSKVYVVESDITNTQNKVEVTEKEATY